MGPWIGSPFLVGAGYFFVWTVFGIAVFPMGVALATAEMQYTCIVARCSCRHRHGRSYCGFAPVHRVEDETTYLLPAGSGLQHENTGQRGHGLAAGAAFWLFTASNAVSG